MLLARSRPWWQRFGALCLAVWFAVATADLPALHTCAMHGGAPAGGAVAAMTGHGAHGDAHAMADDASRGGSHGVPHGGAPHAGHVCSCLGACCGAAPAVGAPAPATLALAERVVEAPRAPGRPAHEYVAAWVDFVLPFSTAPPNGVTA